MTVKELLKFMKAGGLTTDAEIYVEQVSQEHWDKLPMKVISCPVEGVQHFMKCVTLGGSSAFDKGKVYLFVTY